LLEGASIDVDDPGPSAETDGGDGSFSAANADGFILHGNSLEVDGDRVLGLHVVHFAFEDAKLFHLLATETRFGHHPVDGVAENVLWLSSEHRFVRDFPLTADKTGVEAIHFASLFFPGDSDFLCIDDDHPIAAIDVGSEIRAVFAAQDI